MHSRIQQLVEQARRRPMGNSWTYVNGQEFAQQLSTLMISECANLVYQHGDLTLEQGYTVRKYLLKHFEIKS